MNAIEQTQKKIIESFPEFEEECCEPEHTFSIDAAFPLQLTTKGFCWNSSFIKKCDDQSLKLSILFNILWRSLQNKERITSLSNFQKAILVEGFGFSDAYDIIHLDVPPKNGIYLSASCLSQERLHCTHNDTGPAKFENTGSRYFFKKGNLTRRNGPAIEHYDGTLEWWFNEESFEPPQNLKSDLVRLKRWWGATVILKSMKGKHAHV